ncbi:MAG TPA: hypothetical protein VH501_05430 [Solirubrobacterales bacterium]|jgi:hypothetical protein
MDRRGARAALGAIALVALLVLPAGTAAKAKRKKGVKLPAVITATSRATTSADGQLVTPTAVCPPGTVALGGGFSGEIGREEGSPTDLYVVYASRRNSPTSWQIGAVREDAGAKGNAISVTVAAYCQSPKLGKVRKPKRKRGKRASEAERRGKHRGHKHRKLIVSEVSSAGQAADTGERSSATASCPEGLNAISGGYSVDPAPILSMGLKFPLVWADHASSARAWTAGETTSGSTPMTLTSYAYCANTSAPLALSGSGSVDPDATGSAATPPCPAKRPVISGGFDNSPVTLGGAAELATESIGSGGGWTTSAYDLDTGAPASLQGIAYCR